jgi:hypothetical protein
MDVKEQIQSAMDKKQAEYADLTRKIEGCEPGAVRQELKKRRNGLTGDVVNLRQQLIQEELKSDNPQNIPRVSFGK